MMGNKKYRKTPPKPKLVVLVSAGTYSWLCEDKILKVYGDSPEKAIDNWKKAVKFEMELDDLEKGRNNGQS